MIRMEIALFLVLTFVAFVYFSAGQKHSRLHQTFSFLLIAVLVEEETGKPRRFDLVAKIYLAAVLPLEPD